MYTCHNLSAYLLAVFFLATLRPAAAEPHVKTRVNHPGDKEVSVQTDAREGPVNIRPGVVVQRVHEAAEETPSDAAQDALGPARSPSPNTRTPEPSGFPEPPRFFQASMSANAALDPRQTPSPGRKNPAGAGQKSLRSTSAGPRPDVARTTEGEAQQAGPPEAEWPTLRDYRKFLAQKSEAQAQLAGFHRPPSSGVGPRPDADQVYQPAPPMIQGPAVGLPAWFPADDYDEYEDYDDAPESSCGACDTHIKVAIFVLCFSSILVVFPLIWENPVKDFSEWIGAKPEEKPSHEKEVEMTREPLQERVERVET